MRDIALTFYVLIWPLLVAITLGVMCVAVYRDAKRAREDGDTLV
jgi:hypothetical protein